MILTAPAHLPSEPGCIVTLVFEPATPLEREMAELIRTTAGWPEQGMQLWRVVLWAEGRIYRTACVMINPPSLSSCLSARSEFPLGWAEVLRSSNAS